MNNNTKIKVYEYIIILLLFNLLSIVGMDIVHYKTNSFIILTNLLSVLISLVFILIIMFDDKKKQ